jgi:hypothetical protein
MHASRLSTRFSPTPAILAVRSRPRPRRWRSDRRHDRCYHISLQRFAFLFRLRVARPGDVAAFLPFSAPTPVQPVRPSRFAAATRFAETHGPRELRSPSRSHHRARRSVWPRVPGVRASRLGQSGAARPDGQRGLPAAQPAHRGDHRGGRAAAGPRPRDTPAAALARMERARGVRGQLHLALLPARARGETAGHVRRRVLPHRHGA